MSSVLQPAFYCNYTEIQVLETKTYYFYHGAINASHEVIKQLGNLYRAQKLQVIDVNERLRNAFSLPTNFQGIAIKYDGDDTLIKIERTRTYLEQLPKKEEECKDTSSNPSPQIIVEKKLFFYR